MHYFFLFCIFSLPFFLFQIVIGALNQPSVARLKFSWDRVSKKSMRAYNRILAFWSTSHNMGNYRAELKKIKPPAVPYLGLIGTGKNGKKGLFFPTYHVF